jgi:hypothetical protein
MQARAIHIFKLNVQYGPLVSRACRAPHLWHSPVSAVKNGGALKQMREFCN